MRFLKRAIAQLFRALLLVLCSGLAIGARLLHRVRPPRRIEPAGTRRILVIRLDLLGDVINSMPAVAALRDRYPNAHITMLTLPYTAAIPRQCGYVDEVLTLDTNMVRSPRNLFRAGTYRAFAAVVLRLRRERFDLCLSLYGWVAAVFAFASGARQRIGYQGEGFPYLFTDPVPGRRFDRRRHEVQWDLALAKAVGASGDFRAPALRAPAPAVTRVAARLGALGISSHDIVVGIHGGAINGSAKRWPAMHWAALADRLIGEYGLKVVLTGSPAERPISADIHARMAHVPIVLTGETDLDELLAVLARCDLVLSGDSGPLHMAVALGRPTVSIYGPTDPAIYGPAPRSGQAAVVIRRGLKCSPCFSLKSHVGAECPHGQPSCMLDVRVGQVLAAALGVLRLHPGSAVEAT